MARVVPLDRTHRRRDFDCGRVELNDYLAKVAIQHQDSGVSRVFVLIEPNESPTHVLGFFSLSACQATGDVLPVPLQKKFPRIIPAILLGRLAVDRHQQRRGFGRALLIEAIKRVADVSQTVGCVGMFVDAKDDEADRFYRQFGFIPLSSSPQRLFLPLQTLASVAHAATAGATLPPIE